MTARSTSNAGETHPYLNVDEENNDAVGEDSDDDAWTINDDLDADNLNLDEDDDLRC
ncbi:hypothetical protein BDZ89DRAFT_1087638 [Hymenopellis radicata]|nr:hypothetical protein BDZ89DRAFT_1087638 [Hymenopellis radicata]